MIPRGLSAQPGKEWECRIHFFLIFLRLIQKSPAQNSESMKKLSGSGMLPAWWNEECRISAPYVSGKEEEV